MSTKDTSPPTLAQIRRYSVEENYSEVIEDGAVWVCATDHDALIATLHSQIDGLMKRLLREEQDARRLDWLSAQCGNLFTPTRDEIGWFWAGNDGRQFSADGLRQLIDSAMASQGGGDG